MVTNNSIGLSAIHPHGEIYEKLLIEARNWIVESQPKQSFMIMVNNYWNNLYRLSKNQAIGALVPQERWIIPIQIPVTERFGMEEDGDLPTGKTAGL